MAPWFAVNFQVTLKPLRDFKCITRVNGKGNNMKNEQAVKYSKTTYPVVFKLWNSKISMEKFLPVGLFFGKWLHLNKMRDVENNCGFPRWLQPGAMRPKDRIREAYKKPQSTKPNVHLFSDHLRICFEEREMSHPSSLSSQNPFWSLNNLLWCALNGVESLRKNDTFTWHLYQIDSCNARLLWALVFIHLRSQ